MSKNFHRWERPSGDKIGRITTGGSITELQKMGQKAPRLQPGDEWPSRLANCVATWDIPLGTRDVQLVGRPWLPAPTPFPVAGLALLVTGRVPPEQAWAWLCRWTGRLRRPWGFGLEL